MQVRDITEIMINISMMILGWLIGYFGVRLIYDVINKIKNRRNKL